MLQCPKCGASYDDDVEFCFVDGHALEPILQDTGPPSISPPQLHELPQVPELPAGELPDPGDERTLEMTPPPPPPQVRTATPSLAPPAVLPPPFTPEPKPASRSSAPLLLLLGLAAAIVVCSGLTAGLMLGGSGNDEAAVSAAPAVENATPAPAAPPPAPDPAPDPAPPVARSVDITSAPDGAEVWEAGQLLCVTPCKIDHGEGRDLPRQFLLKRGGYDELDVELTALGTPIRGELVKKAVAPRPRAQPKPKPKPKPIPVPVPADDDLKVER